VSLSAVLQRATVIVMTDVEFSALAQGDQFQRARKVYTVVKSEDKSHVVAHPAENPYLLIHFRPQQADQMTKVESKPEPARPKSSHGFPLLERSTPHLPAPHMPGQGAPGVSISLDGALAEPRQGNEIGSPIPEGLEFLVNATAAGIDVQISTHRPQNLVWNWLRVHCPGMENIVHVSPQPPPPGMPYLSRYAYRIDDAYPTVEELLALTEAAAEP
jgi:hypothetical protein